MPIAIIVHGGAGTFVEERHATAEAGCKEAALIGWRILESGGTALDAVEAAVRSLENNPNFNAGTGACLNIEGDIQLDAGIMEGQSLSVGAVADIELIKNPISLARKVMESPHVLLVGAGAQQFAQENGISFCRYEDLLTERQYNNWKAHRTEHEAEEPRYLRREVKAVSPHEEKHGTVGAVAVDTHGNLAAATSTGGFINKYPGRVGDSPLVGCGFYADENAAISCTGHGEDFIRLLIAKRAADYVANGATAHDAAEQAIALLGAKADGTGGLILVDRSGNVGYAWNSEHLARAYMTEGMSEPAAGVS
jgi:beta-aspartyl-peptidase (threonine type)